MSLKTKVFAVLLFCAVSLSFAEPKVSFSGYLDADVWYDFAGTYYTNQELDLGMSVAFTEKVSANVYVSANTAFDNDDATIPAGLGAPADRWGSIDFDGFDITFESKIGTFSVGDLVYQYGGFNYYFYKRNSMIVGESFTRGISYSVGNDAISQTLMIGASDSDLRGDVVGATEITLGEGMGIGVFYGINTGSKMEFSKSGLFFAGVEFNGSFGDALELKLDVGMQNFVSGFDSDGDAERSTVIPLLLEPTLSVGSFSAAMSVYYAVDGDETGEYLGTAGEQFYAYIEPGITISDPLAVGLPLEIHSGSSMDNFDVDGSFWAVPTFYVYPADGVQWWIWAQLVVPFAEGADVAGGLGSEIIVEF